MARGLCEHGYASIITHGPRLGSVVTITYRPILRCNVPSFGVIKNVAYVNYRGVPDPEYRQCCI